MTPCSLPGYDFGYRKNVLAQFRSPLRPNPRTPASPNKESRFHPQEGTSVTKYSAYFISTNDPGDEKVIKPIPGLLVR